MIVDVHAHHFPRPYFDHMAAFGRNAPVREEDLAARFEAMEAAGVGRQVLSPTKAPYVSAEQEAVQGARLVNDAYAALCHSHPPKLSFWASLPLPHVPASIREIDRSFDSLGAVGVTLHCFCLGLSIADDRFVDIYAALNARKATVFLHPCQNGLCSPFFNDWGLTVCAGAATEDSVAAMHLIVKQIPARFPDIRFIVPHFGGALPMLLNRLDGQMPQSGFNERPSATARRFFYDTVGWGSKAALICAVEAFGAGQLVPGSDWPILLPWESYPRTFDNIRQAGLSDDDVNRILFRNARDLIGFGR